MSISFFLQHQYIALLVCSIEPVHFQAHFQVFICVDSAQGRWIVHVRAWTRVAGRTREFSPHPALVVSSSKNLSVCIPPQSVYYPCVCTTRVSALNTPPTAQEHITVEIHTAASLQRTHTRSVAPTNNADPAEILPTAQSVRPHIERAQAAPRTQAHSSTTLQPRNPENSA